MASLLLVGLGNPGQKFEHTRHNFGVDALRAFVDASAAEQRVIKPWHEKDLAEVAVLSFGDDWKIYAVFPQTFMNTSGKAVASLAHATGVSAEEIVILQDELEIPFGEWKWKEGGSAAGHNGVKSIHEYIGSTQMLRLRLGIGRPPEGMEASDYVLQKFSPDELEHISQNMPKVLADLTKKLTEIDELRTPDPDLE